jgi:hypothetical protein
MHKNENYLINLNNTWLDVFGYIIQSTGCLRWTDPRDKARGEAKPGDFIRHYPRRPSEQEQKYH